MRTIPFFLISLGLMLAACTTEPDRPYFGPAPICDESCAAPEDCPAGTTCCTDPAVCGAANRCVALVSECDAPACTSNADCGGGFCAAGACVECLTSEHCSGSPNGKICGPYNTCGNCAGDADCSASTAGSRCAELTVPAPGKTWASPTGKITSLQCACGSDAECNDVPGLNTCRAGGCVCTDDGKPETPDLGCPKGPQTCELGICQTCATDAHCLDYEDADPTTPLPTKCFEGGTSASFCGCAADSECAAGSVCDVKSGSCVQCKNDSHCVAPAEPDACAAPVPPHCDAASGACVECTADAQCTGGTVCDETLFACVTCAADADCGMGKTCLGAGAPGAVCSCKADSDCGTDKCAPTGECKQCLTGADCEALQLGSVCTPEGTCGCNDASECGATTSAPGLTWVCE